MRICCLLVAHLASAGSCRRTHSLQLVRSVGFEANRSLRENGDSDGLESRKRLTLLFLTLESGVAYRQHLLRLLSPQYESSHGLLPCPTIARIGANPMHDVFGSARRKLHPPRMLESRERETSGNIWTLGRLSLHDWPLLIGAFLSLTIAASGEAILPALQAGALNAALRLDPQSSLRTALVRLGVVGFVTALFTGLRALLFCICGARLVARLRSKLFDALLHQPQAFHDDQGPGELSTRLSADCVLLGWALSLNLSTVLRQLLQTVLSVGFVMRINARLGSLVLAGVALRTIFLYFYANAYRRAAKKLQDGLAVSAGVAEQCISLIKLVRSHGNEAHERRRYDSQMDHLVRVETRQGSLYAGSRVFQGALDVFTLLGVLGLGSIFVSSGLIPADALTSLVLYVGFISQATNEVADNFSDIQEALGAATKVFDYIEPRNLTGATKTQSNATASEQSKSWHRKLGTSSDATETRGALNFSRVHFSYPSRSTTSVLTDFSLSVNAGERVAIVGGSGSGKSTVFALALHFYEPTSGMVTLDGVPLNHINRSALRSSVAWVQQEPPLFPNVTIAENIAYGLRNMSREQIEEAAKEANAWEFIERLPDKLETRIGGSGASLSGGQKQRIAIARALVRDPAVLLFDEATSALDPESERMVSAAIRRASNNRTVLYSTHKVTQAKEADHIIVMSHGRIVEEGSHTELLQNNAAYAGLMRAGGVSEEEAAFVVDNIVRQEPVPRAEVKKMNEDARSR